MTDTVKAISLFSGMGGDSLGMKNAGCQVIAFNEFDKHAIKSHELNFPTSTLICDLSQKKEKDQTNIQLIPDAGFSAYKNVVDLIFAGHPCFIGGTKVLTKVGYKNIEDVILTDLLMTHTGKFQTINNLQRKIYNGNVNNKKLITVKNPVYFTNKKSFEIKREAVKGILGERKDLACDLVHMGKKLQKIIANLFMEKL